VAYLRDPEEQEEEACQEEAFLVAYQLAYPVAWTVVVVVASGDQAVVLDAGRGMEVVQTCSVVVPAYLVEDQVEVLEVEVRSYSAAGQEVVPAYLVVDPMAAGQTVGGRKAVGLTVVGHVVGGHPLVVGH